MGPVKERIKSERFYRRIEPGRVLPLSKAVYFRELDAWSPRRQTVKHGLSSFAAALRRAGEQGRSEAFCARDQGHLRPGPPESARPAGPGLCRVCRHDISVILDEEGREVNFDPHSF